MDGTLLLPWPSLTSKPQSMFNKHRRVLWLLNHRTLMPYEAPLIRRLGFEIYIPKIYPKTGFRSGGVDATYDASLTIPQKVLELLNGFNFYEDEWTPEIVTALNRYFGAAFVIPHGLSCRGAVDNFEGQIILRAFGLDNEKTYKRFLEDLYGPLILRKIAGIEKRFWFGEGYDHLHEIEEPLFARRSLFTPIGIPDSFFSTANQWRCTERKILFVCPNAVTDSYYSKIYRKFKQDFGDLPHVIVGAQDVPVDDPHMAGFVSDDELKRLYLNCALLYYHSTEIRHVHYSPIEAAINGMPVVFFEGSLLDRLSRGATKGRVGSVAEARGLIERILADDQQLINEIKQDQREIAYHFSDAYCGPEWREQMTQRGFFKAMRQKSALQIALIEGLRSLMKPVAHGRIRIDPHGRNVRPTKATITADEAKREFGASLYDGIRFDTDAFPAVIDYVDGVAASESWGRWSISDKIVIVLRHFLKGPVRIYLTAVGYKDNAGVPVPVRIGDQTQTVRLPSRMEDSVPLWVHFDLAKPANVIEITVPHPMRPETDSRTLGIGMVEVGAAEPVTLTLAEAKGKLGSSLADGLDFSRPMLPAFVDSVQGLCDPEPWGRWSSGDKVVFELKHTLQGAFRLVVRAVGFGSNAGAPVDIRIGNEARTIPLPSELGEAVMVDFSLMNPSNIVEFNVPFPMRPPGDDRLVGIGFVELRVEPRH